ncbi:ABC transporter ATP-binding protein [Oceanotoga teriensis]|uniref:ABC transporter ATP-binding protein n=1 Tax=Oceanotoga teriensis TaxID=515440 RepID=UPI002713AD4F|nr:ABC transporter ATP-binding protein [Oceanotoga teriensis]MDO7975299.1 ABC transporter ATP-binding protein/permease [Oceanotoga teriensis]
MSLKNKSTLKKLLEFADNRKYFIIFSIFFSALSSILSFLPFIFIWFIIKDILSVFPDITKATETVKYGWLAMGSSVISVLLYFTSLILSHLAAFRVEKNIRKFSMHKIITLPIGYFKQNSSGKLRKIIDDNASLTHTFLAHQLPDISGLAVMPFAIITILFIFDWKLGIVCLFPLMISFLFLKEMIGGNRQMFMENYMNSLETMNSSAVEYIRGIPVVKVFQQTVFSFKNFYNSIKNYKKYASNFALSCRIPLIKYTLSINLPSMLLIPFGLIILLNTNNYKSALLDLIFYMLFVPVCTVMMNKIMHLSESVMSAREALNRVENILEEKNINFSEKNITIENFSIKFNNITFKYPNAKEPVLKNINLEIPEGKVIALVGPSGGGKSTLANLIPRFWDIDQGSITIDNINIKDIPEKQLMDNIAFVFQNSKLFKTSLFENIKMGNPKATKKDVLKAANLAQCDDILQKMPHGLETVIGTKGVYLSGGEQQRIALARAILKDSPIIILDEATAFADPENEYQIQKAFESLIENKTVLIIAHRLSSIKNVDKIFVIKNGRIEESGNHNELLLNDKLYSKMWDEYKSSISWKVGKENINV